MRIGDAEREAALSELQNHMAAGRLSPAEYNERMDKAFAARTETDLSALFYDLPGHGQPPVGQSPTPGYPDPYGLNQAYPAEPPAVPHWGDDSDEVAKAPVRPWFAQWWVLLIALFVSGAADGRLWFLVPMAAIWIWVIWPSMNNTRKPRQIASTPPRPLTYAERDEVILALHASGEVAAIKRYRELTGADLYTATMTVRALNRELGR
ncbi:protein of unknown function [Tessaracoccus bendigoensis DSM 12906]|uniref:DUF1707 domain-containing protein n=2 Tax=Tessaracoccus TaxID=72763 RepID=A0A1M6EID0_9ACTN|nr:protein of unknown function [Tessaracoccus bendigoensis DSM 12906]